MYNIIVFFLVIFSQNTVCQTSKEIFLDQKIVYKDLNQIDVKELNNEGAVGELLMLAREATSLDSTLYYKQRALQLSIKSKDSLLKPYILSHLASTNYDLKNFKLTKMYARKCILISKPFNLRGMLFKSHNLLGIIEMQDENYDLALDNYQNAVENANFSWGKMRMKINISGIYIDTDNFETANLLLDEVFKYEKEHKGKIGNNWMTFAAWNKSLIPGVVESQIEMAKRAIYYAKKFPDEKDLPSRVRLNLADILIENRFFNEALKELNIVISDAKKLSRADLLDRAYYYKARIYNEQGKFRHSLKILDSLSSKESNNRMKKGINELKYLSYKKIKEYSKAVVYSDSLIAYLKEINKVDKQEASLEYSKKYETEKKEQENELLKKDNLIKGLELKKQTTNCNYLILFSLLGLITLGVTYNRFRLKRKTANALAAQNTIINNQKEKLKNTNNELSNSNTFKEKILAVISHDLVNPFNSILGFSDVLENEYDDLSEKEKKEYIAIVNKGSNHNYNLVKNLLDWSALQFQKITVSKSKCNIYTIVEHAIEPFELLAAKKELKGVNNISKKAAFLIDKQLTTTVINNLFSNALKYSYKGGEINISLTETTQNFEITVEDFGVGISAEDSQKLLSNNPTLTSKVGTNKEKGTGFGLQICKEFMQLQDGALKIEKKKEKGTLVKIIFPLN